MRALISLAAVAAVSLGVSFPAAAAEAGSPSDPGPALPPICGAGAGQAEKPAMDTMSMPETSADKAHEALMAGMPAMNEKMMAGSKAPDMDVAFVCAMIPHHQGAIDMARAELQYGKDPANRKRAEKIIADQEREIREMLSWLKARAK